MLLIVKLKVKATLSCSTLCNPMDYRVHRILQARILELVAFSFSRGSSQPRDRTQISCIAGSFSTSLSHKGSLSMLEWVAYPFFSGSSRPRNRTGVCCIISGDDLEIDYKGILTTVFGVLSYLRTKSHFNH